MEKVKWGVLGTADIARGATIPGMRQAEHCELWAIAGRSPEKAERFREEFGFRKAYGSYDELLADPEIEAVYVPLPNSLHCEWAVKALQAKKHVLCEKPLAVSAQQAAEMFRAAEENGRLLMEAYAYLHSPFVQAVKAELEAGTIGEVCYLESAFLGGARPETDIRMRRETYGGAQYDLGCYDVSMALWLLGKEPDSVQAQAWFTDRKIDMFTSALLRWEGGPVVKLDCGMVLKASRLDRLYIGGTKGEIFSRVCFNQSGPCEFTVTAGGVKQIRTVTAPNNYMLEVEQLSRCILDGEKPHVGRDFSLLTARVTDRILAAAGY